MLFWHLLGRENAHIRQVCCGFAAFDQLKNSYRYTIFCSFRGMLFWYLLGHEKCSHTPSILIQNSKLRIQNWGWILKID